MLTVVCWEGCFESHKYHPFRQKAYPLARGDIPNDPTPDKSLSIRTISAGGDHG
jgi:hypothetical protein